MRNPTPFHLAARAIRVQRLRRLFQQRRPRIDRDREPPDETISPPLANDPVAAPELAF